MKYPFSETDIGIGIGQEFIPCGPHHAKRDDDVRDEQEDQGPAVIKNLDQLVHPGLMGSIEDRNKAPSSDALQRFILESRSIYAQRSIHLRGRTWFLFC